MRLWHLIFAVLVVATCLAIARDEVGRVALVVFILGLGEFVLGLAAVMLLFRTVGGFGQAKGFVAHLEALAATALVLLLATISMNTVLRAGLWLLQQCVS